MSSENAVSGQNRARGRSRGNRGKYLRARGRRGLGRAAEFTSRLLLEEDLDADDDEDDQDDQGKFAKREIVDNADKYADPGVQDTNGSVPSKANTPVKAVVDSLTAEDEPETEVDLSSFLSKQRLQEFEETFLEPQDDDIDHTLADLSLSRKPSKPPKNLVHLMEWDASLEELKKEKEAADAVRDLKARFLKSQASTQRSTKQGNRRRDHAIEIPEHIGEEANTKDKAELEKFLDNILS